MPPNTRLEEPATGAGMTRRFMLGSLAAASVARAQSKAPPRPTPNFLFILADDHAGYVLGCDGNPLATTPNMDRLAAEGTRFSAHHCNSPVCTPSRQSFFTGQLPHAAGVTLLGTPLAADKPTLAKQFKKAGYQTAVFGKMHFNRPAESGLHGFDVMMTEGEITKAWNAEVKPRPIPEDVRTKPATWRPFQDPARIWLNGDKLPYARYDAEMRGTYIGRMVIQYLEENRDKRFALWASFQEPHSPFDFPVEDRALFNEKRFQPPRVGPEDAWQIPLIFRDLTDNDKRGIAAAYYTSVAFLDRNVGRVLEALRRLNLEDNTYVIYLSDHGYDLGQHGRFEKHCGFDPALRIPLIMRFPGRIRRGVVADLTEHVDVSATICDMMGLDPLAVMHGHTLRPYLEGRRMDNRRDHIFSEYLENEEAFIRTPEWKYVLCSGRRERTDGYKTDNPTPGRYRRLYDLKNDPGEFADVAAKHPEMVEKLENLMLQRFRSTHPDREKEPQRLSRAGAIEFYLAPRDPVAAGRGGRA
jgi:arylsulfatase A-like enzyme